jgi:hypothetical protein
VFSVPTLGLVVTVMDIHISLSMFRCEHDGVRGLVVMIVACQVMDPGSIPGERIVFLPFNVLTAAAYF